MSIQSFSTAVAGFKSTMYGYVFMAYYPTVLKLEMICLWSFARP